MKTITESDIFSVGDRMSFGKKLKTLRKKHGLSQRDFSKKINISSSTIGMYEIDARRPDHDTLIKIAEFFNVTTDYLLGHDLDTQNEHSTKRIQEALSGNPDLLQFWEELSQRDDLQLLFKQTKNLSPASIKRIIEIIKLIEDEEQNNQ